MLAALRFVGADLATVLGSVGLTEDLAFSPDGRVRLEQLFGIWEASVALTRDPALGVHVAAFTDPTSPFSWPMPLALFEHLSMVCDTLADSLEVGNRFLRLLRDGLHSELELDGERAVVRFATLPEQPPALAEYDCAVALHVARRVSRREIPLQAVYFKHPAPASVQAYTNLFKAPVHFEAAFNGVVARAEDFTRRLPAANRELRGRLIRHAESLLAQLPSLEVFEDKVCAEIRSALPAGNTNASAVAERLGISARTLHRRLQQEQTSYQELLDAVRLRMAVSHLETGKSIAEVAALVGFAQPSTFHRAFKSWTGRTPADYQTRRPPLEAAAHGQ